MPLPKAVEEAGKQADELHAKVYGNPGQPAPAPAAATPAPATPAPTAATPAPQPAPAPVTPGTPPQEDAAYWKNRFEVVQGKYNAEVPRFAEQTRQDRERISQLEAQVKELMEKLSTAPAPAANPAAPATIEVPAELQEKYGKEFVEDMQRMFPKQAVVQQQPDENLRKEIEQLRQRDLQRAKREFFASLDAKAPQWRQLNEDAEFLGWLSGVDDFSGRSRQELFDDAYASFDVERIARFFNAFGGKPTQSGAAPQPQPQVPPLEHQLQPAQNRTDSPPAAKKIWSQGEIDKFYSDWRRGVYRGKEGQAEAERIEQDIFAAKREGRIHL